MRGILVRTVRMNELHQDTVSHSLEHQMFTVVELSQAI